MPMRSGVARTVATTGDGGSSACRSQQEHNEWLSARTVVRTDDSPSSREARCWLCEKAAFYSGMRVEIHANVRASVCAC
eukprot:6200456-Pleurochrysis_carterae.AAC.1